MAHSLQGLSFYWCHVPDSHSLVALCCTQEAVKSGRSINERNESGATALCVLLNVTPRFVCVGSQAALHGH